MRQYFLHVYRGPMAGKVIPATLQQIEAADRDGYGYRLGTRRPPAADRSPHAKAEAFAAAYADRALRPAHQVAHDPLADMRNGQEDQVGHNGEGLARKRGRPPHQKE